MRERIKQVKYMLQSSSIKKNKAEKVEELLRKVLF